MVLGDMGAEVIKIESFPDGDTSRRFEPQVNGESYCFAVLNRNKKSLALDLKAPRGKEIMTEAGRKGRHRARELPPRRGAQAGHRLRQR